jgi:hypothetical protein
MQSKVNAQKAHIINQNQSHSHKWNDMHSIKKNIVTWYLHFASSIQPHKCQDVYTPNWYKLMTNIW